MTHLAQWRGGTAIADLAAPALRWGGLVAATIGGIFGLTRAIRTCDFRPPGLVALYLIGVLSSHLATMPDLPVLGEAGQHNPPRGRMVASPLENIIPWSTAIYFYHGKDGREDRVVYFDVDWSVTSRGPLLPLIITGLFVARDHHRHDLPYPAERRWPADDEGFYLARAAAITLNALLLPAVMAPALSLRPSDPTAPWIAGAMLLLSPFFNENLPFVSPKLLAALGVVLGVLLIRQRRAHFWPFVVALAYYAHPLALLFAPALRLNELSATRRRPCVHSPALPCSAPSRSSSYLPLGGATRTGSPTPTGCSATFSATDTDSTAPPPWDLGSPPG